MICLFEEVIVKNDAIYIDVALAFFLNNYQILMPSLRTYANLSTFNLSS